MCLHNLDNPKYVVMLTQLSDCTSAIHIIKLVGQSQGCHAVISRWLKCTMHWGGPNSTEHIHTYTHNVEINTPGVSVEIVALASHAASTGLQRQCSNLVLLLELVLLWNRTGAAKARTLLEACPISLTKSIRVVGSTVPLCNCTSERNKTWHSRSKGKTFYQLPSYSCKHYRLFRTLLWILCYNCHNVCVLTTLTAMF